MRRAKSNNSSVPSPLPSRGDSGILRRVEEGRCIARWLHVCPVLARMRLLSVSLFLVFAVVSKEWADIRSFESSPIGTSRGKWTNAGAGRPLGWAAVRAVFTLSVLALKEKRGNPTMRTGLLLRSLLPSIDCWKPASQNKSILSSG